MASSQSSFRSNREPRTANREPRGLAQILRSLQPVRIGIVSEEQPAALDRVNHALGDLRTQCRAAEAAAEITLRARRLGVHVVGRVHHDPALARMVVEPWLETIEPQRVAVLADVGFTRAVEPEAR